MRLAELRLVGFEELEPPEIPGRFIYEDGVLMRIKMDDQTLDAVLFLKTLCESDQIKWPIDFDVVGPSDEELAETFGSWFGGQRWSTAGDTFAQFGEDGTGSMFLLWYYPDLKTRPPVVFLSSEGESCLVSNSLEDFIHQLGSGKLFFSGNWYAPSSGEDEDLDWQNLQHLIHEKLGRSDETPEQLSAKARRTHPDFSRWVESMGEYE